MTRALLAAASLLVLAFAPAQYLGRQQDDLLYWIAAKALWTGSYVNLAAVGTPPLSSTAPGWPFLLSPVSLVFDSPAAAQALAALLLAAAPWAIWAWLKRRVGEREALLAALLCASSPLVLAQAGTLMPEAAYLLVFLGALAAAESGRPGAAGACGALLVLIRPAGLSALPALAARGRAADAAKAALPGLAAFGAWALWSWTRSGGVQEARELALSYGGAASSSPVLVAVDNARFFAGALGGSFLPPSLADGAGAVLLGAALIALAAYGAARARKEPAAVALAGAALMHALWTWRYERYWIPLLPLLLWALARALDKRAVPVLGGLLAAQLIFQTLPRIGRPSPWAEPELARTYARLKALPAPGALASALPARDGWHAGRPSLPLPTEPDAAAFAARLKGARARFVLRQDGLDLGLSAKNAPLQAVLERAWSQLEDERRFKLVFEEPAERAMVYEPR